MGDTTAGMSEAEIHRLFLEQQRRDHPPDAGPCNRRNPHTPHDSCPGTAPEYPSERVEVVADFASAYARANLPGYPDTEPDECWATGLGQREVHDLGQCSHYADEHGDAETTGDHARHAEPDPDCRACAAEEMAAEADAIEAGPMYSYCNGCKRHVRRDRRGEPCPQHTRPVHGSL
jgi:hypothetical protein